MDSLAGAVLVSALCAPTSFSCSPSWLGFHVAKKPLVSALCASALFGFSPLWLGMVAPFDQNCVGYLRQSHPKCEKNKGMKASW